METADFLYGDFAVPSINTMGSIIPSDKKISTLPLLQIQLGKISQREIARRLGIGKTTVNRWAGELGFVTRKHTSDETFFDTWSQHSVYLLGYILTDGNIAWNPIKGYYTLTITAAEKDKAHLELMRNLLQSTKPLLYAPKTRSYRLIVNSKILCRKLMRLGILPRKSLTVKFPKMPKVYLWHFIRGVVDGDGSVNYFARKRSPYFSVRIYSGSPKFLHKLVQTIKTLSGIEGNVRRVAKNVYGVDYSCSRGKKLAHFLYSGASISLERKYLQYKNNVLGGKRT